MVQNIKDINRRTEAEAQARSEVQEKLLASERKVNLNKNCLEEARSLLDQTDKARRCLEQELTDTNDTLGEQTCINQSLTAAARKAEQEVANLNVRNTMFVIFTNLCLHRLILMRW